MHELTCGVLVSKRLSKGFVSRPRNGQLASFQIILLRGAVSNYVIWGNHNLFKFLSLGDRKTFHMLTEHEILYA